MKGYGFWKVDGFGWFRGAVGGIFVCFWAVSVMCLSIDYSVYLLFVIFVQGGLLCLTCCVGWICVLIG